jgi:transcriptional regulator GlxA family with amidase domain
MKRIALLLHEDVYASSIGGVLDLFADANGCLQEGGKMAAFVLELVRYTTIDKVQQPDLIIIPGFKGDPRMILEKYHTAVTWIREMYRQGTEIASMCSGSFFLAEAGLLDGKAATCHWALAEEMQTQYPSVAVQSDRIITDQDGIYTSGGGFSALKLILYLIEKFCGRQIVLDVSKRLSIDIDYISQAHFAVFAGQRKHADEDILRSQTFIEENYATDISIDQVSSLCNTGKRNFIRRFKAATNNTPIEYLQRVRIEAAKKVLENEDCGLDELMCRAGYEDIKTFRMIFKRITGLSPRDYRKKYSRRENVTS